MISFRDVSHDWGGFSLKNVSFTVEKGEYFVILGPTGAGKTLLLETVAGFYVPKEGKILLRGLDCADALPEQRGVGFVYQDYALFPHMTVEENIRFGLEMKKVEETEAERRVESLLGMLSIESLRDRYPETLSGGERQRVAIARALVIEPDILLLDEPLSALDTRTRESLRDELKRIHKAKGITTLHVTHDQSEALLLADSVAVIMDGEVAQLGTPEKVFNYPVSAAVADFVGVENVIAGTVTGNVDGVASVEFDGYTLKAVSEIEKGEVYAFLRPENVILSEAPIDTSARNVLESTVAKVTQLGSIYQVHMNTGLSAVVTKQSVEELGLSPDVRIYASFKATAVHLIRRD
ncbi:ATP-binding cassette domain-containing protein [Candidatus Bathyarchaeota archaeon]|nr:ATP-binding cassette domain-containing protein [Candidatus Bathyarchaeota archaeon]